MTKSKNSPPNLPFLDAIKEGLAAIVEVSDVLIRKEQNTLEEYLEKKSPELDKYIVDFEKSGLGKYVAGEVSLVIDEDENFHLEGDFYFNDESSKWIKKSVKGKPIKMNWAFLPDDQEKLRASKKITFEYNHP